MENANLGEGKKTIPLLQNKGWQPSGRSPKSQIYDKLRDWIPQAGVPGVLTTTQPCCSGTRALGKFPQGKKVHSCFSQNPNTPIPQQVPVFYWIWLETCFKNHSSSLIENFLIFPTSIFQANFKTAIPHPTPNTGVFPNFLPTFLNTCGEIFPGRGMQTGLGKVPYSLGAT